MCSVRVFGSRKLRFHLVGMRGEKMWFFSVSFWRILTSVCVLHVLSTYLRIIFRLSMWKPPQNFLLTTSALANKDALGRDARWKWVIFSVGDLGAFWHPCVLRTFWVHIGHFSQTEDVKTHQDFCSHLRRSQTKILFWLACAENEWYVEYTF